MHPIFPQSIGQILYCRPSYNTREPHVGMSHLHFFAHFCPSTKHIHRNVPIFQKQFFFFLFFHRSEVVVGRWMKVQLAPEVTCGIAEFHLRAFSEFHVFDCGNQQLPSFSETAIVCFLTDPKFVQKSGFGLFTIFEYSCMLVTPKYNKIRRIACISKHRSQLRRMCRQRMLLGLSKKSVQHLKTKMSQYGLRISVRCV